MKTRLYRPAAILLIVVLAGAGACMQATQTKESVQEVVVYRVDKDRIPAFLRTAEKMHAELKTVPGFISIETRPSIEGDGVFMDVCQWESKEHALAAMQNFPNFKNAAEFMSYFDGDPIYMGHFQ